MEQLQLPLLWLMLAAYVGALVVYGMGFWARNKNLQNIATKIVYVGVVITAAALVLRSVLIGGLPLNNGFEFGLCFVFVAALAYVIIERKFSIGGIGLFVMPILVVLGCWLVSIDLTIEPVMPALRSYWLAVHVSAAVISYGAFAVSFAVSIAYLLKDKNGDKADSRLAQTLPSLKVLDEITYKLIFVGLPFLTIMLVTGAVWAEYAWGAFWSWDPKETWALITWLVYAIYLHTRFMKGFKGKRAAWLSVLGFAAVIFTFFGVSYLLPGMHSYLV
ncbi:MAG: c-type cytochrome biogenesis protein CcsB [Peptococcaceae bacterium]|jgi:cytochrome c-type biogenesis protein CcsB|nr:c-type cytochrome biogenesis protein CcsB [Peptococcaceae bacterium]